MPATDITQQFIPDGWRSIPFWSLFRREKKTGFAEEELLSVYRDYGVIPKSSRDDNHNKASEDLSGYQLVTEGALVTNKMKAWQGSIAISRHRGIVSPAYYVYTPLSDECDQFLHYLLRSDPYIALYGKISKGVRVNQWDLEHEALRIITVPLPDLSTQRAIADFLDRETARIDSLIEKKQRLVELLGEKRSAVITSAVTGRHPRFLGDSGIRDSRSAEGGGEVSSLFQTVAKGWTRIPLHYLADGPKNGAWGGEKNEDECNAICIRVADFDWSRLTLNLSDPTTRSFKEKQFKNLQLCSGDILIEKSGGGETTPVGRVVSFDEDISAVTSNFVARIRPRDEVYKRYFLYLLAAHYMSGYSHQFIKQNTGIQNLDDTNLFRSDVWISDLPTQRAIADFLDCETARVSKVTERTRLSIDRLKEYRSALITSAVTGQIDVSTYAGSGTTDRQLDAFQSEIQA
jgi:type I restriction enzyme, S subunit